MADKQQSNEMPNFGGMPPGMPGMGGFDFAALQQALQDPSIRQFTENLAQDPSFQEVQKQLQEQMRGGAAGGSEQPAMMNPMAAAGSPAAAAGGMGENFDMNQYMKAMEGLFQNDNFMNMATKLGQQMIETNPDLQKYSQLMQNPETKQKVESKMEEMKKDPELAPIFQDIEKEGPSAMFKYFNDPRALAKFNEAFADVAPKGVAGGSATLPEEEEEEEEEDNLKDFPLLAAAADGELETLEKILKEGKEDINQSDEEKRTGLHFSAGYGHSDVVKLLLKYKANIDIIDNNKNTPLHYSAGYGQLECTKVLVEGNASLDVKNDDGKTPGEVAALNDQKEVVEYLTKNKK